MDISTPLKPAVLHILMALSGKEIHGYAVMQTVREQSNGRVPLQTGSFYRHLSRLIADGLVEETPAPRAGADPRRGAYYRLTPRGRQRLSSERRRLVELVAALDPAHLKGKA